MEAEKPTEPVGADPVGVRDSEGPVTLVTGVKVGWLSAPNGSIE